MGTAAMMPRELVPGGGNRLAALLVTIAVVLVIVNGLRLAGVIS